MPGLIRIDFYKTEDENGEDLDIGPLINQSAALPFQNRRVDYGDSFVFLHNVGLRGAHLLGEIVKAKMNDLPDKVSRDRGEPEDLDLRADEGISNHAHFLYDSANQILLFVRSRDVRPQAFVASVSQPINATFGLSHIFQGDALERLDHMRVLRKLTFKIARPQQPDAFRNLDPSVGRAIELLDGVNGRFIDVTISASRSRNSSLERGNVLRAAREMFGHGGEDVRKIIVSGRENEDSATEMIDLFQDRLVFETQIEERRRRLDPADCQRALIAAHRENVEYLRGYRHPE